MAELNIEKEVINYRNRFLKSVLHDLFVKYEKRNLLYVIAECIHEIYGNYPINTEADGSQWLSLDDYDGELTQRALDAANESAIQDMLDNGELGAVGHIGAE